VKRVRPSFEKKTPSEERSQSPAISRVLAGREVAQDDPEAVGLIARTLHPQVGQGLAVR